MEDRAPGTTSTPAANPQSPPTAPHHEGRGVWVLTAYAICGLALLGMLAYYFSAYVTR